MSNYLTIDGEFCSSLIIDRSEFICRVKGIENEEQAKEFIAQVKKKEPFSSSNCYAYIADEKGLNQKFSDDGEPQGTAGLPMLNVLKNKKLFKTVAIVTRYYGGIKLGAGGLVRAFGNSVVKCLDGAKVLDMQLATRVEINIDYFDYSGLLRFLESQPAKIISTNYEDKVCLEIAIKKTDDNSINLFQKALADFFNGKVSVKIIKEGYFNFN